MKRCINCQKTFDLPGWTCPACGFTPESRAGHPAFVEPSKGDGFNPDAFADLERIENLHFWFRARNRLIMQAIRKHFSRMQSFLEVGCGTGFVLSGVAQSFPSTAISGSEYHSEGLPYAFKRVPQAFLCQADARNLPFTDHFDVIGAFDVLEHINEDADVLTMFNQALHPGGGIILTVPQHQWLWSKADENACHLRRYTRQELTAKVRAAGFRVEYATSFTVLLLPILMVSRLYAKTKKHNSQAAELRISGFSNKILEFVMNVEARLINSGIRFPFGGSLLLVARKR